MTTLSEVMDRLRTALPEFEQDWDRYIRSDLYGSGEHYNDVTQLARYLVEAKGGSNTAGFQSLFGVVERLLDGATADVRDLIAVGFLEDLQNLSLNTGIPLDEWGPWLQPATAEAWRMVAGVWQGFISKDDFNRYIETGVSQAPTDTT